METNNLGKAIRVIRRYLGDTSDEPTFIETIPKHGYRFIAEVTRIGAASAVTRQSSARSPACDFYIRGNVKAGSENLEDNEGAIELLAEGHCARASHCKRKPKVSRTSKPSSHSKGP